MTIEREEFEARLSSHKEDLTAMGNAMRSNLNKLEKNTREDFKSVWKAINGMLIKVAVVVTACTSVVMAIFKIIENGK